MPTARPRTQLTHTPAVQRALEVAKTRWPKERPAALLLHLIEEGANSIESRPDREQARRRDLVARHAGAFPGIYEQGYLERLRQEWPE